MHAVHCQQKSHKVGEEGIVQGPGHFAIILYDPLPTEGTKELLAEFSLSTFFYSCPLLAFIAKNLFTRHRNVLYWFVILNGQKKGLTMFKRGCESSAEGIVKLFI